MRANRTPLANRLSHARQVARLQITKTAVDGLEMIEGCRGAEIVALDERHGQPALRCVVGDRQAIDTAADHQHVELACGQGARDLGSSVNYLIVALRADTSGTRYRSAMFARTGIPIFTIWKSRRHPTGSPGFFADLEQYHFEKLHHLPRLIPFDQYRGRRVLEVGCGAGTDLIRFSRNGARATGVDLAPSSIALAAQNFAIEKLHADLAVADGEALPFGDCVVRSRLCPWRCAIHLERSRARSANAAACSKPAASPYFRSTTASRG